jgi:hypothetical protein
LLYDVTFKQSTKMRRAANSFGGRKFQQKGSYPRISYISFPFFRKALQGISMIGRDLDPLIGGIKERELAPRGCVS